MQYLNKLKFVSVCLLIIGLALVFKPSYYYLKSYVIQYILHDLWINNKSNKISIFELLGLNPIGKLNIPSVDIDCIILDEVNDRALSYGIAKVSNGARIYDYNSNIVIAGHRDSYFNNLKNINIGDKVYLEHIEGISKYLIENIKIVSPYEVENTNKKYKERITLITCYPFQFIGDAPYRYIVQGRLIVDN